MIRFLTGIVLLFATIAGIILLEGGSLMYYITFSSFIIVALVPFFASFAVWGLKDQLKVWQDAFIKGKKSQSIKSSCRILDFYEKMYYLSGFICVIVGTIIALAKLNDISNLGVGLALSLVGLLYGLWFAMITRILKARIENNLE